MVFRKIVLLLLLWTTVPAVLHAAPVLQPPTRILILTDTRITNVSWPVLLEQYFRVRHPDKTASFFTLSFHEEGIPAANRLFTEAILPLKPTMVILQFGPEFSPATRVNWQEQQRFTSALTTLCSSLAPQQIPLVTVNGYAGSEGSQYGLAWSAYRAASQAVILEQKGLFIDLIPTLTPLAEAGLALTYQGRLTEYGHVGTLLALVDQFGWMSAADLIVPTSATDAAASLSTNSYTLRPPVEAANAFALPFSSPPNAPFLSRLNQRLRIPRLTPGRYQITVEETDQGIYSAEQLDAGIQVLPATFGRAPLANEWVTRKQQSFSSLWLEANQVSDSPEARRHLVNGALTLNDGMEEMLRELTKPPTTVRVKLSRVMQP